MLKPGLGKGLDDLMRGDQVAGKERRCGSIAEPGQTLGRGLNTLIQADAAVPKTTDEIKTRPLLPSWFYFAADLLLLAYTVAITLDADRPFDAGTILFCVVSVLSGAILSTIGVIQASTARTN